MKRQTVPVFVAVLLTAASASGEKLPHHVVAPGGQAAGPSHRLTLVVGQSLVGQTAGPSQKAAYGYLHASRPFHLPGTLTAVAISYFNANLDDKQVELDWAISEAVDLQGFHIYRSEEGDATGFVRLNTEIIPAAEGMRYQDPDVVGGKTYWYRLGAVDRDGEFFSPTERIATPKWATELRQNYPNPFNPATTVRFYVGERGPVTLNIYNVRGELVRRLVNDNLAVGSYELQWNGTDDRATQVASGVYFYRLTSNKKSYVKKMLLLK